MTFASRQDVTIHLGDLWHTPAEPPAAGDAAAGLEAYPDGALAVGPDGRIVACGRAPEVRARCRGAKVVDHGDRVILPGFVDAHVHFPQIDMIGAYGERLLGWLDAHTYPAEARFADRGHAAAAATRFVAELAANGTTLAAVYSSSHPDAAEALLGAAERGGLRMIVGKTSMDRAAPAELLANPAADLAANERLISTWHGRGGRLYVALTPRFALSCTPELLAGLGALRRRFPDVYVQSHHAETPDEVQAVRRAFPGAQHYLGVYDAHGLVGPRTVMGHAVHATDTELALYAERGAAIAHCPSSNLFLGSGLFPLARALRAGVKVGLGTDVGAGTSFSLLRTMGSSYEVQQLAGTGVSPARLLYHATLGGARALALDHATGSFAPGKEADFQILDWRRSRLLAARWAGQSAAARLFALCFLGDDRLTAAVHVGGRAVYTA
jgi:guanine deaminase